MNTTKILVPVDFTEVSDLAVEHAIAFAKRTDAEINLLHVIDKKLTVIGKTSDYDNRLLAQDIVEKLQDIAYNIETRKGLKAEIIAIPGNIFDTINSVASEIDANFVFMGTHGLKGWQHLRGSNALRVIYHSPVPFILSTGKGPSETPFKKIVFPIDIRIESAQKTNWAIYFAKFFGSEVHIIYPDVADKYLHRKVQQNLAFVKKVLSKNAVPFTVTESDKDHNSLADETNRLAAEISADLIMIMIYPAKGAGEFFLTPDQQKVIENKAHIPVICINPSNLFLLQTILAIEE
ncbi:MAG TPA: hypothetical protein DCQ31_12025 [Bacteroidales bacterium]|nr:hypothetical protein [Bacteroidales bacterium]